MNLRTELKNDIVIIYVNEERLDAHNSGELKVEVQKLFEQGRKNMLIDLKDVRFIDSSGLGASSPDSKTPFPIRQPEAFDPAVTGKINVRTDQVAQGF